MRIRIISTLKAALTAFWMLVVPYSANAQMQGNFSYFPQSSPSQLANDSVNYGKDKSNMDQVLALFSNPSRVFEQQQYVTFLSNALSKVEFVQRQKESAALLQFFQNYANQMGMSMGFSNLLNMLSSMSSGMSSGISPSIYSSQGMYGGSSMMSNSTMSFPFPQGYGGGMPPMQQAPMSQGYGGGMMPSMMGSGTMSPMQQGYGGGMMPSMMGSGTMSPMQQGYGGEMMPSMMGSGMMPPMQPGYGGGMMPSMMGSGTMSPMQQGYGAGMMPSMMGSGMMPPMQQGYGAGMMPSMMGSGMMSPMQQGYGGGMPPSMMGGGMMPPMQQGYGAGMPPSMMDNGMMPPVMGGMGGGYNPGMVAPQGFDPSMMNSGGGYTQPPFPNPNASNNFSVDPAQGNDNSNDNVNMVGDMSSTNPVDQTDPNANSVDPNASDSVVQDSGSQDSGVQDSASQNDSSQDPNAQDPNASPEELATDPSQQDPNAANFSSAPAPVTGTSNAFGDAAAQAAGDTGALSENITQILQDPATHIDFVSSFTDPQYQSAVRTPLETAGVTLGASSDKTSLVANVGGTAIPLQLTPDQANQALTQMKSTGAYQIEFDRIQAIQVLMQQSSVGN